ncbi:hypothetical protein PSTG_13465 [Puccinia striiformis f. sp. tritici PST-78]|uniref:Uncharacterized protein n=1 Tax=Puccinia striiformis f. sp. tritici PST-78 TaxID=1165861 RepID=A0A0L0V1G5_9BASI|nr:hypothetical protein PSTG_13465 [Puccinia striiformis f. sp. tritici PST-78]
MIGNLVLGVDLVAVTVFTGFRTLLAASLRVATSFSVRAVAQKLRKSPNSKTEFVPLCREFECDKPHSIVKDVRTRWNSTLDQLVSIIRCHKAIMAWQKDKKHGLDCKHHLLPVDIQLAKHLVSILQVFYEQTLQVLTPGSAWLTHIILFIDKVTELLSNTIQGGGGKYPPSL